MEHSYWTRVGDHVGHGIDSSQFAQLIDYRDWLVSEALPVGGIGPAEAVRIDRRHIADSLLFAAPMQEPGEIWDLGSGAGLPGIPLAILLPRTSVVLIDRSSRSADLMRRAIRILDLPNVRVEHREIDHLRGNSPTIVSRAALPPEKILRVVKRHLDHQGVAIVGGSWTRKPSAPGWETLEIPRDVLDHTVWLLIMRRP
ncbi:MAG: RsmG family class I SAM-dependent methyltransferase [Acidimicrobiia bacterium]